MTNKKSLFKKILISMFSVLVLALSIFSSFITTNKNNKVFADSTSANFYGSSFYVPINYESYTFSSNIWNNKTWNGLTSFSGRYIWHINDTYYYSNSSTQYVLDISTSTWSQKTWTGLTSFSGNNVWTDGINYYYSNGSTQYVLDISTSTWSQKTWTGLSNFYGYNIWNIGNTYYYSSNYTQYVLDISTSTWSQKTWTGLTSFGGINIWHINDTYYYSNSSTQYVLDISTSTWSQKTWTGLTSFGGENVWTDGTSYYYSSGTNEYALDIYSNTWYSVTWSSYGGNSFSGANIWNIGNTYYFSSSTLQIYMDLTYNFLTNNTPLLEPKFNSAFASISFKFLGNENNSFNLYASAVVYFPFESDFYYSVSNTVAVNRVSTPIGYAQYIVYDANNHTFDMFMPFMSRTQYGFPVYSVFKISVTSTGGTAMTNAEVERITFGSSIDEYTPPLINNPNDTVVTNSVMYSNSLNQNVAFSFDSIVDSDEPLYYYADDATILSDILTFSEDGHEFDEYFFRFNTRTYFIGGSTSSIDYSQGYDAGYTDGLIAGGTVSQEQLDSLAQSQYNAGYNSGYLQGSVDSNEYTFLGLIAAVIDAPVAYFISLFNFEILGVNLVGFITGLFTLAIIIVIVKKVV